MRDEIKSFLQRIDKLIKDKYWDLGFPEMEVNKDFKSFVDESKSVFLLCLKEYETEIKKSIYFGEDADTIYKDIMKLNKFFFGGEKK